MTNTITFEILNSLLSESRLQRYLDQASTPIQLLSHYNNNILLCAAMIPTLHYFEVCLRNRINLALGNQYTNEWIITHHQALRFSDADINKINELSAKIRNKAKKDSIHDDVIAQMSFGFWCSLFHKRYDQIIWHRKDVITTVFPNLTRINRKRSLLEAQILKIKKLRNRIAHHESIIDRQDELLQTYKICHVLIGAMSPHALKMLGNIDRFLEVYKQITSR